MYLIKYAWWAVLWMRQILFLLYLIFITSILAIFVITFGLMRLPSSVRRSPAILWSFMCRCGMFFILWMKIKVINKGAANDSPCVYICKHQSSWETIVFHSLIPKICFVLKQELLSIPLFGQGLKYADSIPIDRSQSLKSFKKVLKIGKDRLNSGVSIVIFPEGTRVPVGRYPKFHKTAITLAKSTNARVVPVAHNSGVCWPNKIGLIKPGFVTISFGEPVNPSEYTINELNQHCYDWINNQVKQFGG